MKKRLLIIAMHMSTGGSVRYILEKIKKLNDVYDIFAIEYSFYGNANVIHRNQIIDIVGENFHSLGDDKSEIFTLIESIKPDIIYMGELPEMFMDNEIAKKIYSNDRNYNIVATTHDSSWDIKNIKFLPDQFIFVSEFSKQQFAPLNIPSEVVLYPIEYKERPDRTQGLLNLGLDPNKKHVLNIGIFTRRKNQGELFEYARKLENENVEFHFIGSLAENFKDYWGPIIKDKPANCRIWGERSDVDNFYSCMDLFVFTSSSSPGDRETNPLVIRECISWNIPLFMYDLDVYLGMYDKYKNIKYLSQNKEENLKMIENELCLNDDKYIYIYAHNYLVNNWRDVLEDQLKKLIDSGLYDSAYQITYGVYSKSYDDFYDFVTIMMYYDTSKIIKIVRYEDNDYEFSTLSFLQDEIKNSDKNIQVLYYHLKGVTSLENHTDVNVSYDAVESWRHVMEYFLIEKWKDCIKLLENHDTVGCFWNDENHYMYPNMYCGNFWWSKSEHIKKLPNILELTGDRMNSERWIGMRSLVWYNFYSPSKDNSQLYEAVWKPEEYRDDIKVDRLSKLLTRRRMLLDYLPEMIKNDPDSLSGINEIIDNYLNKESVIAEIGSYAGVSTELFAIKCGKVYAIDTWDFTNQKDLNSDIAESEFDSMCKNYDNIVKIKDYGVDASKLFDNNSLDAVYIDACHDYDCVEEDIETWLPKIKYGGIICGHDYNQPQVAKAVHDSLAMFPVKTFDDTSWLVKLNFGCLDEPDDSICVVTSHPNYKAIEETTIKCIKSLKATNRGVILGTHCGIFDELKDIVDHWKFDSNNPMIDHDFYNRIWFDTDDTHVEINLNKYKNKKNHAIPCHNNMYNGIKKAKELNIKYAIVTNFDLIFDEFDTKVFDDLIMEMKSKNKKSFFMYQNCPEGPTLKTVFFITDVDFYLEHFTYIKDEKEYNEIIKGCGSETNCLENVYYNVLKSNLDDILIKETTENELFPNSFINIFSMCEYITILPIDGFPEYFCIWYSTNNKIDSRRLRIDIIKNGNKIYNDTSQIINDFKYTKKIHYKEGDVYEIDIRVINEINDIVEYRRIIIDDDNFNKLYENGIIKYNKKPKISVITRVKNMSDKIELLYFSLMEQNFEDFEWVIFDNNSTDDIYAKVHLWNKIHKNIHYKHLPEFMDFWNNYTETLGEILVVVDADDFLHNEALWHINDVFENNKIDLYIGKNQIFGDGNMRLLDNNMFDNTAFHPTCYTRKCIERTLSIYSIEFPLTDDHEIVYLIMSLEYFYCQSSELLYFYRKFNEQSITWNSTFLENYQNYPDWQLSSKLLDSKISNLPRYKKCEILEDDLDTHFRYPKMEQTFADITGGYDDYSRCLKIVTIVTSLDDANIVQNASKINIDITPLIVKEENLKNNFRKIIKFIDKYCGNDNDYDDDMILFCDKNSQLLSSELELVTKFKETKKNIVFAVDKSKNLYNSFIGYSYDVRKMLDEIVESSYTNNDNAEHQLELYAIENNLGIDTKCDIFTTDGEFKRFNNRIYNEIANSFPSILINH